MAEVCVQNYSHSQIDFTTLPSSLDEVCVPSNGSSIAGPFAVDVVHYINAWPLCLDTTVSCSAC